MSYRQPNLRLSSEHILTPPWRWVPGGELTLKFVQLSLRMGCTSGMYFVWFPSGPVRADHKLTNLDGSPGFPDPFAVATIGGEQTQTTSVIKKTLNPYWNEAFDLYDSPSF